MIPQISGGMPPVLLQKSTQPSRTYRETYEHVFGVIEGKDALKQSILNRLTTERYSHFIYSDNYGAEFEQLKGASFQYIEAVIETLIRECLEQDDRVVDLFGFNVKQEDTDSVLVSFSVDTELGIIEMEVTVSV
jgi:hypothetical protein